MQKIFELTSKDFLSGLAVSSQMPQGIFINAAGINPFRNPFTNTADTGLLQASEAVQAISSVSDSPFGATLLGSSYKAYLIGDAGHFYDLSTSDFTTISDLRSGTPITDPAEGVTVFQAATGTKYLYYWQKTQIGTWNLSGSYPAGWTDNTRTGLQSTIIHPVHQFVGNVYYGNKDRVGVIIDDGDGTPSYDEAALDLASTFTITTLSDDGHYLIVGATENQIGGNITINTLNKILFWDTFSSSWNSEWEIVTPYIASIRRVGIWHYALCADGLYAFTFANPPTLLVPLTSNDAPATVGGVAPTHQITCVKDNVFYWLSVSGHICAFGSPIPGMQPRFYKPFQAFTGDVPSLLSIAGKFRFLTADYADHLGSINNANGGNTGVSAETIFIPLERKWNIMKIEVILGEPMASGDSLNIDVKSDEDTTATDWGTLSYAGDGAVRSKMLISSGATNYIAENLKLVFNFNGGNVKIKKVMVYGDPMTI